MTVHDDREIHGIQLIDDMALRLASDKILKRVLWLGSLMHQIPLNHWFSTFAQCVWMFSHVFLTNSDPCSVYCMMEIYKSTVFLWNVYVYVWNDQMNLSKPYCILPLGTHTAANREKIYKFLLRLMKSSKVVISMDFQPWIGIVVVSYLFTRMGSWVNFQILSTRKTLRTFSTMMWLLLFEPRIQYIGFRWNFFVFFLVSLLYLPPWYAFEHEQAFYIERWSHDRISYIFPNGNSINRLTTQWHGLL